MTLDVASARDMSPTDGSLTIPLGPPGIGKSWFAGTMAEYLDPSEVLLIATLPREVKSYKYQQHDLDTIVVVDKDWVPEREKFQATGYDRMLDVLEELREDEQYKGVIIDNGTEMCEMAWHNVLASMGVKDPVELNKKGVGLGAYGRVRDKNEQLFYAIGALTGKVEDQHGNILTTDVAQSKLVCIPWHVQPPKETVDDSDSADEKGKGVEYEGEHLPMIRGSFRRRLAAIADNMIFCDRIRDPKSSALDPDYMHVAQVRPDNERHTKLAGPLPPKGDLIKKKFILNEWSELMKLLKPED